MKNKIFWAFDAFDDGLRTNFFVGEALSSLNQKLKAEIHPVFCLGAETVDSAPSFVSDVIGAMTKTAEKKMGEVLDKIQILGILPSTVIVEHGFSRTKMVKNFINHAEKNGANLIVVGSHGKKGLERALLGSFTETLLMHSHIPVLVVGQNFDQIPKWNEILFPTDFSDDSAFALNKVVELAKVLSSKITLFHHLGPIVDPVIQSTMGPFGGVWVSSPDEMELLKAKKIELLEEWSSKARKNGVEVKTYLDTEVTNSSEAILNFANKNSMGLITMATQSGSLAATLFGAITRKVVRQSLCPVWLLRRS